MPQIRFGSYQFEMGTIIEFISRYVALKFRFSEKATKIWRNLPQDFDVTN